MKPKRVILLVSSCEMDLSTRSFMLTVNGYKVIQVDNAVDAVVLFAENTIDLVLCDTSLSLSTGAKLVYRLKTMRPEIPMVLLGALVAGEEVHAADACLSKTGLHNSELLERIKVMVARKRGPKKGTVPACVLQKKAEASAALQEAIA